MYDIKNKYEDKEKFQKLNGLTPDRDVYLLCVHAPEHPDDIKTFNGLQDAFKSLNNTEILIISDDEANFAFKTFKSNYKNEIYKICDTFLLLPNQTQIDLKPIMEFGTVPIVETKQTQNPDSTLVNYNALEEIGNCFAYTPSNEWGAYGAIIRSQETFKFPYDWKHIMNNTIKMAL